MEDEPKETVPCPDKECQKKWFEALGDCV